MTKLLILAVALAALSVVYPQNSRAVRHHGDTAREPVALPTSLPVAPRATPRADRTRPLGEHKFGGELIVETTAYTATGERMADGKWPQLGDAASNLFPLGTRLVVEHVGEVVVEDRVGCCSQLDIYLPTERACVEFGRRWLRIVVLR